MPTVFIAGSITIKRLDPMFMERIDNIASSRFDVVVGDADGADASIQAYLLERGVTHTTVYCSGASPRNNVGDWPVHSVASSHRPGTRAFFTDKDVAMARAADYGLMVWDGKSTGTLSNVIELLGNKKKAVVFLNKEKTFRNVNDASQLEELVRLMSEPDRRKADEKIHLLKKLDALKHDHNSELRQRVTT